MEDHKLYAHHFAAEHQDAIAEIFEDIGRDIELFGSNDVDIATFNEGLLAYALKLKSIHEEAAAEVRRIIDEKLVQS